MKFTPYLLILFLPFSLFAREIEWTDTDWTLEFSGAYYMPSSKQVRRFYSGGWTDYQVQTTKRIYDFVDVWGSVGWMSKQRSFRVPEYNDITIRAKIYVAPLAIGLRWIYPVTLNTDVYFGVGGCFSYLNIYNSCLNYKRHGFDRSPFKHRMNRTGCGALIKSGIQYALTNDLFLDFFVNYLFQSFHFKHHHRVPDKFRFKRDLELNGLKVGLGVGVYF